MKAMIMVPFFQSVEPLDDEKQLPPKYVLRFIEAGDNVNELANEENKLISRSGRDFVKMRVIKNERVTHVEHFQVSFKIRIHLTTFDTTAQMMGYCIF